MDDIGCNIFPRNPNLLLSEGPSGVCEFGMEGKLLKGREFLNWQHHLMRLLYFCSE